jgi:hypothetical protein
MEYWNLKRNEIFQKEWEDFKDVYSTEGYSLKYVFEIYLPFWECKQNIVVEKKLEPDRFSKILLKLIKNGKRSHMEICQFLGIEETDFCTMQIHFLIKNNLIEQNGSEYEITHEGLAFLEKRGEKPGTMEIEEFEYMAKEKFNFLENDMTNDFFDQRKPIDKQWSDLKKMRFSGYKILQTHKIKKIEKEQGKIFIEPKNNPTYRKVVKKRDDFLEFFKTMKPDKIFYDFADSELKYHQRNICFLCFLYENRERPDDRKIHIRQFEETVEKFENNELEKELSKKMAEYVLKNVRFGDNAEVGTKISEDEPQKETLPPSTLDVSVPKQSLPEELQQQQSQQSVQNEPKKASFTADVSKVVDLTTVLARIQKSKQEKAAMRTMRYPRNIMSNEFKFCSECGKKLKIKAKYCTQCGTKQEE